MLSESPHSTGSQERHPEGHPVPGGIANRTHADAETLTRYGVSSAELAHWAPVLQSVDLGIEPDNAAVAVSRLKHWRIAPEELRNLVDEYPRLGPGGAFPGFRPGTEEEMAMQLDAVRAKLQDLERMHDSTHAD